MVKTKNLFSPAKAELMLSDCRDLDLWLDQVVRMGPPPPFLKATGGKSGFPDGF